MRSVYVLIIASASSLLGACVSSDLSTGTTEQHVTTRNRLSTNRLSTNRLSTNRLSTNRLSTNKLAVTDLLSSTLLATNDGRTLFSYVASCAMPAGTTLEAIIPGATDTTPDDPFTCVNSVCDFEGSIGLTPGWADTALDAVGQGWISACLLARVNAHDTAESISLRGPNDALAVAPDEALLYTVEEGAFYGNVFDDGSKMPDKGYHRPLWFACEGEGQASGEFGGLVVRDCTEPMTCSATEPCKADPSCVASPGHPCPALHCNDSGYCASPGNDVITQCGFTWTGYCADYTPQYPSPYACADFSAAGYYEACHDAAAAGTWKKTSIPYAQVITTFVTP